MMHLLSGSNKQKRQRCFPLQIEMTATTRKRDGGKMVAITFTFFLPLWATWSSSFNANWYCSVLNATITPVLYKCLADYFTVKREKIMHEEVWAGLTSFLRSSPCINAADRLASPRLWSAHACVLNKELPGQCSVLFQNYFHQLCHWFHFKQLAIEWVGHLGIISVLQYNNTSGPWCHFLNP